MKIKEARINAGLTQAQMSLVLGIPLRTIENWDAGVSKPTEWAEKLIVKELESFNKKPFKINNDSVRNYAEVCKKFANDTRKWGGLDEFAFYTTGNGDWCESSDNANGGIDVAWAFHLTDEEIEMRAAEELFEHLMQEIDLADSDGWDKDGYKSIYEKFNF